MQILDARRKFEIQIQDENLRRKTQYARRKCKTQDARHKTQDAICTQMQDEITSLSTKIQIVYHAQQCSGE
jgi:hypothetical protein